MKWRQGIRLGSAQGKRLRGEVREQAQSTVRRALQRNAQQENGRLREGLRRLANQDYDSGYTAERYADAVLSGWEPSLGDPPDED